MKQPRSEHPQVSVVIPTIGRSELGRAVASARAQVGVDIEVVVVVDRPSGSIQLSNQVYEDADKVVWSGGVGGSGARNAGVRVAAGTWLAFLDDDDEWMPLKLQKQLQIATRAPGGSDVVVASRHVHVDPGSGASSVPIPARLKRSDEPVADYLFRRRRPTPSRPSMYTSTLLCNRGLALRVPWDESLKRHQDWDWLIRADRQGAAVLQAEDALVRIQTGTAGSISAGDNWLASLEWATRVLRSESMATYVDFVTAQTLRYAIAARSWGGIWAVMCTVFAARRLPAPGPVIIGFGGLLSRRTVERMLTGHK